MKKIWESWLKEGIFLYCVIYTATTIVNSVAYLSQGIRNDPSGNWHELERAIIVFIGIAAYELAIHLPVRNVILRSIIVYVPTMLLAFFAVWTTQFVEPLAQSAYRDIFINYTGLFVIVAVIAVLVQKIRHKHQHRCD